MWFSHLTGPLGPRVRTQYKFLLDYVSTCEIQSTYVATTSLECLDINDVGDIMNLSYVDPDAVDVIKTSRTRGSYKALIAKYY